MKFETTAGQLRHLLGLARQVIATTPTLMAYSGAQFVVDGDILQVIGSDGETTVSANGKVTSAEAGTVLVLPKPLATYLGTLGADTVLHVMTSEPGDELLVGPAGSSPYRFRTLASTFPQTPYPQGETREVDFSGLAAAVTSVRGACSRENPVLQVLSDGEDLILHSTDNYRLARASVAGGGFGTFSGVLGLQLLERVAKMDVRAVTVDAGHRLIGFSSPQARIVTRVLAVPFPAVDAVLSARPKTHTSLPAAALLEACGRLASVSDTAPVECIIDSSGLRLEVNNADLGAGRETVTLVEDPDRQPIEFMVRLGYLSDAVQAAGSEVVDLHYSGPVQPLFLTPSGNDRVITVVMPVRG